MTDLDNRIISNLIDDRDKLTAELAVTKATLDGVKIAVEMMKAGREDEQQLIEKFIADWNKLHGISPSSNKAEETK